VISGGTYQAVHDDGVTLHRQNGGVHFAGVIAGGGARWISFSTSCGGGWLMGTGMEYRWDGTNLSMGDRFGGRTYAKE
jgi:hypothetical protein